MEQQVWIVLAVFMLIATINIVLIALAVKNKKYDLEEDVEYEEEVYEEEVYEEEPYEEEVYEEPVKEEVPERKVEEKPKPAPSHYEETGPTLSVVQRTKSGLKLIKRERVLIRPSEEFKIGGKKSCQMTIEGEGTVSGMHAIITRQGNDYYIMDISSNGTEISAIPYEEGKNVYYTSLSKGRNEMLLNNTMIRLAKQVELIFEL